MIEQLKHEYGDFTIQKHKKTGWVEIITPFASRGYLSVSIKDNLITDNGNTLKYITKNQAIRVSNYVCQETKYWNGDLQVVMIKMFLGTDKEKQIICINFTPERLMPFIQLLIKIQGIIENED